MANFALTGVGGFIAPRHLKAIHDTGNQLVAAVDPKDSVGILDRYSFDVRYFNEFERFDRYVDKLRRGPEANRVQYVSVCSPNYLHDAHCRFALRVGCDAICEKPLVINPWNLTALEELEQESKARIWTVLQLRVHEKLVALREQILAEAKQAKHEVVLTYITARGNWYDVSWKGQPDKAGGVPTNIGIHFFDMLAWIFGGVQGARVHLSEARRMAGFIELERARVRWYLSVEPGDLPEAARSAAKSTFRSITVDGTEIEFSDGFTDLHTKVYERTLAGNGFGIQEARPSIELAHALRTASLSPATSDDTHPLLRA